MMLKKKIRIVSFIFLVLLLCCAVSDAIDIYRYSHIDEKQKCDVAIVLGAETNRNEVSPVYRERINHGIWLYKNGYVDYIILTGGKGDGAEFSDACIAKNYARSKNIPEKVIFLEEHSTITEENLKNAKKIMKENKWDDCIIVSDPFHMKRAMVMAEDYDMNAFSSPTPTSMYRTWKTKVLFLLREDFFFIGYKIFRFLGLT